MSGQIEEFSGVGKVFEGEKFIADVSFKLTTYPHQIPTHDLSILTTSGPLPQSGAALTLHIGDNDKLKFHRQEADIYVVHGTRFQ